jgi:hypothetical protein
MRPMHAALATVVLAAVAGVTTVMAQAAPKAPPRMLHPAAGKQECLSCHGVGANAHVVSVPAAHHFANAACGMCHKPIAEVPPNIKHALDPAHAECRHCHVQAAEGATPAPGAAPAPPASHATFDGATCRMCHEPAAASAGGGGQSGS